MLLEVDRTEYEVTPLGTVGSGAWAVDVTVEDAAVDGRGRTEWSVANGGD